MLANYQVTIKPLMQEVRIIECVINNPQLIDNLIKEVDEYVGRLDYLTNVQGQMTDWKDLNRSNDIKQFFNYLKPIWEKFYPDISKYTIGDVWGNKLKKNDFVKIHSHKPYELSGIIYLSENGQGTHFPEIDLIVKEKKGKCVLFPSNLNHFVPKFESDNFRYTIAFNFNGFFV
jgi:hypothetical protein